MGCHQTQLTTSLCEKLPNVDLCRFGAKSWALRRVGREKSGSATPQWMFRAAALRITGDPCSGEVREQRFFSHFSQKQFAPQFLATNLLDWREFFGNNHGGIYIYIYVFFFGGGGCCEGLWCLFVYAFTLKPWDFCIFCLLWGVRSTPTI